MTRKRRTIVAGVLIASLGSSLAAVPAVAAVAAPELDSPADGATLTYPTEPPVFRWLESSGAVSYRIEIDDAPDFIDAVSVATENTAYAITTPQTIGQPFYWRVQSIASNGRASAWSSTYSYETAWPDSRPTLLLPSDGDTVTDISLSWSPVPGAATYQVQVSPNGDWANNVVVDTVVKGTVYSPPETLDNSSYFWRVRGRDSGSPANTGAWSFEWQFTRAWTTAPQLLSPADSIAPPVPTPTLAWEPVPHASHYEVQLGTDLNFSPNTYTSCFTNHTELTFYETEASSGPGAPGSCSGGDFKSVPGTVYAWRVRGVDAPSEATSPWSDVWQFLFRAAGSDTVTLVAPANHATVGTPVLTWDVVPDIERYEVTIVKPGGSTVSATTAATSWAPTSSLTIPGTYQWYVQTVDSYGKLGVIGEERDFTLEAPSTSGTLTPLTPANASSSIRMPSMTWTPVTDAAYYEVWYSVQGSGVEQRLSGTTKLRFAAFTYSADPLPPGTYTWYAKAFDVDALPIATGSTRSFTIEAVGTATYLGPCLAAQTPCTVKDTPTLSWEPEPQAGSYLVYIAQDAGFTNVVKTYSTQYTRLTPRESLLDNQAGKAYYWFVRPCVTSNRCGRYDAGVFPQAFAFRKLSKAVEPVSPTEGEVVQDLVTFEWEDYLTTNLGDVQAPTQEAKQYRIQVSTVADFASILDEKTVDQTTYTPHDRTYPEGTLYWRVQAIDGSGNPLTRSASWSVVKSSTPVSLMEPAAGATLVADPPTFSWNPQDYAARYDLEVYENGDLNFSPSNRILSVQTRMAAWAATKALLPGTYAWRVRRLDADNRPGPWSDGRKFKVVREATVTVVKVTKTNDRLRATGSLTPPVAGADMELALFRKAGGSFQELVVKVLPVRADGSFTTEFKRPKPGTCRIVATFAGDDFHRSSSDTVTFDC